MSAAAAAVARDAYAQGASLEDALTIAALLAGVSWRELAALRAALEEVGDG